MNYAAYLYTFGALLLSAALWQGPDEGQAQPPHGPPPPEGAGPKETLEGALQGYNFNPGGRHDSLMLTTEGGLVQLNFPAELADQVAAVASAGSTLNAHVRPERSEGDHQVYRLEKLWVGDKELVIGGEDAPESELKGVIKSFNYGRHGETNGFVLESGDFVQLGPKEAERVRLEVGQELTAKGHLRKMPSGKQLLKARVINGVEVKPTPPEEGPHGGPKGRGPAGGPKGREPAGGPKGRGPR
jgi:hypothetical protein